MCKDIYIPKDLDDCFVELKRFLSPQDIEHIKVISQRTIHAYHFYFGKNLRNRWGMWTGSRLATYFNSIGIHHADDMSGIIMTSFWRHLNGSPIKLEEQVKFYQQYWRGIV